MIDDGVRIYHGLVVAKIEQEAEVRSEARLRYAVATLAATHVVGLSVVEQVVPASVVGGKRVTPESVTEEVAEEGDLASMGRFSKPFGVPAEARVKSSRTLAPAESVGL